jgi:hypothetical protein
MKIASILNQWWMSQLHQLGIHTDHGSLPQAREDLSSKGYTQREAAEVLGVSLWHLNRVLCGHRPRQRTLDGIAKLPAKGGQP